MAVMYSQNGVIVRKVDKGGPIIEPSDPNYVRLFSLGGTASSNGPHLTLSKSFKGFEIETVVKLTRFGNRWGWLFKTNTNTGLRFNPDGYYNIYSNGMNYQGAFGGNEIHRLLYIRTRYHNDKLEGVVKFGSDPGNINTVNFTLNDDGNFTNSSLNIFGSSDYDDKCSMSVVYLKIFEGQEEKLALVPVYDIQNNVYKFYDAITDSYFNISGNASDIVTDFGMNLIH